MHSFTKYLTIVANSFPRDSQDARKRYLRQQMNRLPAEVLSQHWGLPYDETYLVLSFGAFEFQPHEVLVLSFDAMIPDDDQGEFLIHMPACGLKENTWLTPITLRTASERPLYLHYFYLKDSGDEAPTIAHGSQRIYDGSKRLAVVENDASVDGIAIRPHPSISPRDIPIYPEPSRVEPALAQSGAVYEKLFLAFNGLTGVVLNCYPSDSVDSNDYIAYNTHTPVDASDYVANQWEYVTELTNGTSWPFYLDVASDCYKYVNNNWWVLDLDKACKWKIFYCKKNYATGKWYIAGNIQGFAVYPTWMSDTLSHIGSKMLHQIAIPGTHDSGVFDVYAKGANAPLCQAQNLSFADQMKAGARYFDCRLKLEVHAETDATGVITKHGVYNFTHSSYVTYTTLADMIEDVRSFMASNKEILILDFSRCSGFTDIDYQDLFQQITTDSVLSGLLAKGAHKTKTINDLMSDNKRLVLLSDQASKPWAPNYWLYESINIDAEWANTSRLSTLEPFLEKQIANHSNTQDLWSLQAQLTPIPLFETMYSAAHTGNPVTAKWIYDKWWNKVNVVFIDFVCEGGMIANLIEGNIRKFP